MVYNGLQYKTLYHPFAKVCILPQYFQTFYTVPWGSKSCKFFSHVPKSPVMHCGIREYSWRFEEMQYIHLHNTGIYNILGETHLNLSSWLGIVLL